MRYRKPTYGPFVMYLLMLILASCSKDSAIVCIDGEGSQQDSAFYDVSCRIKVKQFISATRSDNDVCMQPNTYFHLYAYKSGASPANSNCFARSVYRIRKGEETSPIHDNMRLNKGLYDFYVVALMDASFDRVPYFNPTTGLATELYNGEDYLWSMKQNVRIDSLNSATLEFSLQRCATSFEFDFELDTLAYTLDWAVMDAPTHIAGSWMLGTGAINPIKTVTQQVKLNVNVCKASGVILPSEIKKELKLSFSLVHKANHEISKYQIAVPMPKDGVFAAAHAYRYSVDVANENISLKQQ